MKYCHNNQGWALLLLLFVTGTFIAVVPLISTHLEKQSISTTAHERWTQWQRAKETLVSGLANSSLNYPLPNSRTFSIDGSSTPVDSSGIATITTTSTLDTDFSGFLDQSWQYIITQGTLSGSGTAADPYVITNAKELDELRNYLDRENEHFRIEADIDLASSEWGEPAPSETSEGWIPVGSPARPFKGIVTSAIDSGTGQPYGITGLYIDRNNAKYQGLFGVVNGGNLSNFRLIDVDITASGNSNYTGALVGYIHNNSSVTNSYASGTVEGRIRTGGLIGEAHNTDISQSGTDVAVSVDDNKVGTYVGGLVGHFNSGEIATSFALGPVTSRGSYSNNIGGLVGNVGWHGSIRESYATGNVTTGGKYAGGLVGNFSGGGGTEIANSYATGNVSSTATPGDVGIGGLLGRREHQNAYVTNSYAVGSIISDSAATGIGGLIGLTNPTNPERVSNSFYSYYNSAPADFSGEPALSTGAMTSAATFTGAGWSTGIWILNGTDYPHLASQTQSPPPNVPNVVLQGDEMAFVRDAANYRVYVAQAYTTPGPSNFTPPAGITSVDALIVAGGGGGGTSQSFSGAGSGGGGAGGLIWKENFDVSNTSNAVTVGNHGLAPLSGNTSGGNGENSTFSGLSAPALTAIGGGGGIGGNGSGRAGGSGGGSRGNVGGLAQQPTSTSGGFGNAGGTSGGSIILAAATGGGGAGSPGQNCVGIANERGGDGGAGLDYSALVGVSFGDAGWFAGGGGGGAARVVNDPGDGGKGGGGRGGNNSIEATPGIPATGGGGGGGNNRVGFYRGANGGSGIVIIRYPL